MNCKKIIFILLVLAPGISMAKVNVLDYGAKADGKTDDTAAIQRTLDAAAKDRGGVVEMPKGLYRVEDHLVIPPGVCLSGEWQAPHHANTEHGTVILAVGNAGKEDGPALINLGQSSAIKGITIFYPDQDPAAVKPYPWAIQGKGMHGSVIDVTLVNPYKGIDFGTYPNELHYIRNVFGCPLKLGDLRQPHDRHRQNRECPFQSALLGTMHFQYQGPRRGLDEVMCLPGTELGGVQDWSRRTGNICRAAL